MFVNGIPFLTTLSRKIKLQIVEHIQTRTDTSICNALPKVMKLYAREGFVVNLIMMDREFTKLELSFDLVEINTTAAREHVDETKQSVRTIRDCGRPISTVLTYTVLPKQVVIDLIYYVVMFLNVMAAKTGISDTISPRGIVMRRRLDWNKHCTGEFGEYVEAHSDPEITNTPKSLTVTVIYLGITENI